MDRRRVRPLLRWSLAGAVGLLLVFLLVEWLTWPDVAGLAETNPTTTAFIEAYRERRRDANEPETLQWRWVPYDHISANLKAAVIASEDIEFFSHDGFSTAEMRAALRKAWEEKRLPRGASTITQQVAKNLWLSPSRNPGRKVKEALLTKQLERHLGKRRILEIYLNVVEFGRGIYGAEAAARAYFGKPAAALGPREGALLAASLPRPTSWHPGVGSRGYLATVARIERRVLRHWEYLARLVGATGGEPLPPPPADLLPFVLDPEDTLDRPILPDSALDSLAIDAPTDGAVPPVDSIP